MFIVAAVYHVLYQNWTALTTIEQGVFNWILSVVFALGNALVGADKTIEQATRQLVTNTVPPVTHTFDLFLFEYTLVSPELGQLGAVLAILGALSTVVIYLRLGKIAWEEVFAYASILESVGVPLVVYVLAVIAASAVQGQVRVPFQGVVYLFQNFDAVVESARMNATVNQTNLSRSSALEPVRAWLENQSSG